MRRSLSVLQHGQDVARRILEPGDVGPFGAEDAPLVLIEPVVALELTPRAANSSTAVSISSTGKFRIV